MLFTYISIVLENYDFFSVFFWGIASLLAILFIEKIIKRIHDMGHSWRWILMPIVGKILIIFAFFMPGTNWENQYGVETKYAGTPIKGKDKIITLNVDNSELWQDIEYDWYQISLPKNTNIWDEFIIRNEGRKWIYGGAKWDLIYIISSISR